MLQRFALHQHRHSGVKFRQNYNTIQLNEYNMCGKTVPVNWTKPPERVASASFSHCFIFNA